MFVCFFFLESDVLEATAQFDFIARSDRELSLKKGDHVTLFSQVSNDWWRGSVNGKEGLIPDKYILLKIKYAFSLPKLFPTKTPSTSLIFLQFSGMKIETN